MKLIAKTLVQNTLGIFLYTERYEEYRDLIEEYRIDISRTYHGNTLYMIEIVPDDKFDQIQSLWEEVVEEEKFEERGISVTMTVSDALDKK